VLGISVLLGFVYLNFFAVDESIYPNLVDLETLMEEERAKAAVELPPFTPVTERYSGQIDRVSVVFEQRDYTEFRLTTNGVVQEGVLNTERGYAEDVDATVYVLNWRLPESKQLRYVRLTGEPGLLYLLSSDNQIIRGSVLSKE
jgi:hypothetical protein